MAEESSRVVQSDAGDARATPEPAPRRWMGRLGLALAVYALCTLVFAWLAGDRLETHTMNNHFAVQAEVWKQGRWYLTEEDMIGRARRHELDMGNDWAVVKQRDPTGKIETRYFNSFPVFPAVVMYPFVSLAGSALMFRDGLFLVAIAGIGPALLFLALERLKAQRRSRRTTKENFALSLLLAFGSVYFYTSVQGTVWFAAHVVAIGLTGGYLLAAFNAERLWACLIAGILVGCGFHTRTPFLLCVPLFAWEAMRASVRGNVRTDGSWFDRAKDLARKIDVRMLAARYVLFSVPIVLAIWLTFSINQSRFGNSWEFGHTLLNVVWMERVKRWGLFSYHYLSRNLTCAFTLLPILNPPTVSANIARFQFSGMGLALWVTTPMFLWLIWPKNKGSLHLALWATVVAVASLDLLYQNSGWVQFGYRFSNDFSPYLFVLLAIGARPFGLLFKSAALWAIALNFFGALSFGRRGYEKYYFLQTYSVPTVDGTPSLQTTTYPPD